MTEFQSRISELECEIAIARNDAGIYICIFMCMYICMHICIYICLYISSMYVYHLRVLY
jgi:hypothetical protein